MPGVPTGPTSTTKEALVLVAERLFAARGIDGVSIRQILSEAGVANNSAVTYHFESKAGLVRAIVDYRAPYLAERRRLLWAQAPPGDLRAAVEAQFLPVAELAEFQDSHYMTFLEQLDLRHTHEHVFHLLPSATLSGYREYEDRVGALLLPDVPEPMLSRRLLHASSLCIHVCAMRERGRQHEVEQLPLTVHINELFDLLIGVLTADISEQTRAAFVRELP